MTGEFLNISALDPLLPTFLIATLCLCAFSVITYYSLAIAWEVFWASRRSPSPLDPSAEVVLTEVNCRLYCLTQSFLFPLKAILCHLCPKSRTTWFVDNYSARDTFE